MFERELRKVGVAIHYATGGGDPSTPEGSLMIGMQQLWDEFERNRLSRETKRGMREASEQGYRAGGRAPYGYRRRLHELPDGHRGDRAKHRVTLEPEPEEALVIAEIFELFVARKAHAEGDRRAPEPPRRAALPPPRRLGPQRARPLGRLDGPLDAQKPRLHRPHGLEPARLHRGQARRRRRPPAGARGVGDRPGDPPAARRRRDLRGGPGSVRSDRARARLGAAEAHLPVLGDGALLRRPPAARRCTGKRAQGPPLLRLRLRARTTATTAALEAHGGQKWVYVREDWLERLVLRFFEQRIFGPMRLERLAKQLRAHDREQRRNGKLAGTRMRQQIVELDRKIKAQVQALENGIEPELVSERIAELRGEKEALEEALAEHRRRAPGGRG